MAEKRTIRSQLERGEVYVGVPSGVSMLPMLSSKTDVIVVAPKKERLRLGDVGVFTRGSQYVLHRVVEVLPDGYVFWGDNCAASDGFVDEARVIGRLEGFSRKGKDVDMDGLGYRWYVRAWNALRPLRCLRIRLLAKMKGGKGTGRLY